MVGWEGYRIGSDEVMTMAGIKDRTVLDLRPLLRPCQYALLLDWKFILLRFIIRSVELVDIKVRSLAG